jgi:hypothetical protein
MFIIRYLKFEIYKYFVVEIWLSCWVHVGISTSKIIVWFLLFIVYNELLVVIIAYTTEKDGDVNDYWKRYSFKTNIMSWYIMWNSSQKEGLEYK